jgi:GT2 family glycosyltransferase
VDFTSKVNAINTGYEKLAGIDYQFIGILDGDVTFDSRYYENVLNKFAHNNKLGIAGGIILDQYDDHHIRRSPANSNYVSGCIQLFRRKCFEDVGGLFPIREGGEDTIAAITAQMKGWEVEAFEDLEVFHHKHSKLTREKLKEAFRAGRMFYALGSHPSFEIMKTIKRIPNRPFILATLARMSGYFLSCARQQERPVSPDFIRFLRKQQIAKLKDTFTRGTMKWS